MNKHFSAIVIGSGFGGAVVAYELSKAGLPVCVFERGRAYPPGSFPRSPNAFSRNFWDPSERLYGLFNVWSFQKSEAIVSSGLGGGSLIYANVLMRKPSTWFVRTMPDGSTKPWPLSYDDLSAHYDEVERKLGANPFPLSALPEPATRKARAFATAATDAGLRPILPPLAISFGPPGTVPKTGVPIGSPSDNLHATQRQSCRLCGECDIGCNYGAKNTLDFNYLSEARRQGAHIHTMCEVRSFLPHTLDDGNSGYLISYVEHHPDDPTPSQSLPLQHATCRYLILAAGTLGSTYLLLKNRNGLGPVSAKLGTGYSTNGDFLAFAMHCNDRASPPKMRQIDPSCGPVITTSAQVDFNGQAGGLIQDAGYPDFVGWMAELSDVKPSFPRLLRFLRNRVLDWWRGESTSQIDAEIARLIGPGALSCSSLPLLAMGTDYADGRIELKTRRRSKKVYLDVDWSRRSSARTFDRLAEACESIASAMGGSYAANPFTHSLKRIVTVHPLGGCAMGDSPEDGVVDRWGEVFGNPNLYVADGSVMPAAVGTNPSLTIAAVARHIALGLVARYQGSTRNERKHE